MRFHTQTAGCRLTAQQPLINIVRTATEALSAVLGGTQSLHTNSFDEALALPTERAVRVALRTQQIIAHETGVTNTIDPLGGSYFVEALTDRLEAEAYAYFAKIDELGGMVAAVEQNYPQREIADASFRLQQEIERGERIIVGVNQHVDTDEPETELHKMTPGLEQKQIGRIQAVRARRDSQAAETTLAQLRQAADSQQNLMQPTTRLRTRPRHRRRNHPITPTNLRHLHRNTRLLMMSADSRQALTVALVTVQEQSLLPSRPAGRPLSRAPSAGCSHKR